MKGKALFPGRSLYPSHWYTENQAVYNKLYSHKTFKSRITAVITTIRLVEKSLGAPVFVLKIVYC